MGCSELTRYCSGRVITASKADRCFLLQPCQDLPYAINPVTEQRTDPLFPLLAVIPTNELGSTTSVSIQNLRTPSIQLIHCICI
jgi:hypothetical protein